MNQTNPLDSRWDWALDKGAPRSRRGREKAKKAEETKMRVQTIKGLARGRAGKSGQQRGHSKKKGIFSAVRGGRKKSGIFL